ncbi:anthranilate synthase component I family protein [Pontibacter cellulosilyticus]|uniref:Chorismate-binding protein n=1 Tax=Pontibacter cellulosilyticus TaxID=1720253 RepID=A0A923N3N6_9BACT|nr:anthranilate synthase component I family protein [Pontibacter cellulosilyticus]MBC5991653.1 chorismate-binding protein [Pontibacter cellulosilyticus]
MFTVTIKAEELPISLSEFQKRALAWADKYSFVAYYNPNDIAYPHNGFEHRLAVSSGAAVKIDQQQVLQSMRQELSKQHNMWCGYLAYDLKNQIENLNSHNSDNLAFPLAFFFEPEVQLYFKDGGVTIKSTKNNTSEVVESIIALPTPVAAASSNLKIQQKVTPEIYKANVECIKAHILEGDVYELNYCMEFYAEDVEVSPLPLYLALNEASPTPFSGYLKYNDKYLLCASPERFLKKEGPKLISQPIKGTIRRGQTPEEDAQLQHQLRHDEKELAENMMIVDLVRNDLSRSCGVGTVQVEEMFGIYGFRQVSQMISTVSGELREENNLIDALAGAFPMGSMTGAPKISAMQLIEELEVTKRGLYSGTFGYITPENDCDFNVVIRSIQYNASNKYLSFMVGSAITYDSDPEHEYEECLLKAQAIMKVLNQG